MKIFILISVMLVLASTCFAQKGKWKRAQKKNTIESYQIFLNNHPNSQFSEDALNNLANLEFEDVKKHYYYSSAMYENYVKKYSDTQAGKDAILWIDSKKANQLKSLKRINNYSIGTTTENDFNRDGWNVKDPWIGNIGIVKYIKKPSKSIYILGICDLDNPKQGEMMESSFAIYRYMSPPQIDYSTAKFINGVDCTQYIAILEFVGGTLVSLEKKY